MSDALILSELEARYRQDIWAFACEQVITLDEAAGEKSRWPADKLYLKELLEFFNTRQIVVVPKSRRMMVSWAAALWATWKARFFHNQHIFIQSESETKAAFIVGRRCAFIEDHLRFAGLMKGYKSTRTAESEIGKMEYDHGSIIQAIAQGGEKFRAYTMSALISDEVDFQQDGHEAYTAALPAVEKGAKLFLITTSNGPSGVVAGICADAGFTRWAA